MGLPQNLQVDLPAVPAAQPLQAGRKEFTTKDRQRHPPLCAATADRWKHEEELAVKAHIS